MVLRASRLVAITLVALSLGASFAHVLELPAKLALDGHDYLRVQTIDRGFGPVASVLEPLAILGVAALAVMTRRRLPSLRWTIGALGALIAALIAWVLIVSPENAAMAAWSGAPPADWTAVRDRWEWGHAAVFALKLIAFGALIASVLVEIPRDPVRSRLREW